MNDQHILQQHRDKNITVGSLTGLVILAQLITYCNEQRASRARLLLAVGASSFVERQALYNTSDVLPRAACFPPELTATNARIAV